MIFISINIVIVLYKEWNGFVIDSLRIWIVGWLKKKIYFNLSIKFGIVNGIIEKK